MDSGRFGPINPHMPKTTVGESIGEAPQPENLADVLAVLADHPATLRSSVPSAFDVISDGKRFGTAPTSVGTPYDLLLELAGIKAAIRNFYKKEPDQVVRECSAYSARLTELWTELRLLEQFDRQFSQLRTMQVGPVLEEIDRQYKFATSLIAVRRQDIELSK